jgi:hypothetical protein
MKILGLFAACLLLAGCSSISPYGSDSSSQLTQAPSQRYHHETVSEFNDGETKFLQLVPDDNP